MKKIDAFGVGNALIDFVAPVTEETIVQLDLKKGIMQLVDEREFLNIIKKVSKSKITILPGGSAANTIIGMSKLGSKTAFSGSVGDDFHAREYSKKMKDAQVKPYLSAKKGLTGTCICLVTPDKERTMATCLASSSKMEPQDLNWSALAAAKLVHLEGYQLTTINQSQVVEQVCLVAKEKGITVSFDCADPFVVRGYKKEIQKIIKKYAKIIFLNEAEAKELTGLPAAKAIRKIGRKNQIIALKIGKKGSLIWSNGKVYKVPIRKVIAKDTTGAGDLFAAGFLHAYLNGKNAKTCGLYASYLAAEIVSQYGAYLKSINKRGLEKWLKQHS